MSDRVVQLELEVSELKEEVESQRAELQRLRKSLAGLRAEVSRSATPASATPQHPGYADSYSEDSYTTWTASCN